MTTNYKTYTIQELLDILNKLPPEMKIQFQMKDDSNGVASSELLHIFCNDSSLIFRSYLEQYDEIC